MNKRIYTSNYARNCDNPMSAAISVYVPSYYMGTHYKLLAPSWEIVSEYKSGNLTTDEYSEAYIKLLVDRNIDPIELLQIIPTNTILLCYESPSDFCHRHVLVDWINTSNNSQCIQEWKNTQELVDYKQDRMVDLLLKW